MHKEICFSFEYLKHLEINLLVHNSFADIKMIVMKIPQNSFKYMQNLGHF